MVPNFHVFFFSRVRIFGFASLAQMRDIANFGRNENTMRLYIKTRINSNEKVIFAFAFDNNVCGFTKAYNDLEHGAQTNDTHTHNNKIGTECVKKFLVEAKRIRKERNNCFLLLWSIFRNSRPHSFD